MARPESRDGAAKIIRILACFEQKFLRLRRATGAVEAVEAYRNHHMYMSSGRLPETRQVTGVGRPGIVKL